ncbi:MULTISPECIES: hemolysin III family protein [Bacillales]|uniref:Hemolysin III family protein n=1 Tax=Lysinibacillus louembei TaxID=1470088 RepID=A0ABZ0RVB8_9BACI|nr:MULTISPECIES: hemolysin III family protein [Bacillales]MCT6925934.1 hemolysin III family protein [Metasolibacillus sp.]MCT6942145.1 hemolysin III family protein [Metasolibacillus sp.]WPK11212.1 hemolysin III family protein [Lysinibacillus louembei]
MQNIVFDYKTKNEELWNAITHGIGLLISIPACVWLILQAIAKGGAVEIVSYSIFGASLIILFLNSTLLHSMPERFKYFFAILDHSAIYILIAGTYTPFLLITLDGALSITLLCIIWGIAIFGVVFKCLFIYRFEAFSLGLYIAMGWLIIFVIKPVYTFLQFEGFLLLLAGGLCFTFGAIFYAWNRLPYNHAIWHIFVIAGCACMVSCVLFYL